MSPALINGLGGSGTFNSGQRRGPIAAEFQGPGPASVALPSTIGEAFLIYFVYILIYFLDIFHHYFIQLFTQYDGQ